MTHSDTDVFSFGAMLRTFRTRRRLTQQQLAENIGLHRSTIVRWEQGDFLPQSKALVLELARHLHLDEQESRRLLEASLTALAPYWCVPLPRNPFFTGREEILEALQAHLDAERAVALTQSYALHGLGGMGKTQLALEYAYRHALEYRAVCWIEAESRERITASLLRLAEVLALPDWQQANQQQALAAAQHWLATHPHWLLIWDNLDDPALLHDFLPPAHQGTLLITTRCAALGPLALGLDLLPMGQEEGVLFLLRRAKVLSPSDTAEQLRQWAARVSGEYAAATDLVRELGGLPLALDQAGAYLEETGCSLGDYLQRYSRQRARVLSLRGTSGGHHPQSVATTFRLALARVEREQPAAAELLRVCALLQAEALPEELFIVGAAQLGPQLEALGSDPFHFDQAMAVLRRLSLVQRQPESHTLSLHRLVQAVLLDAMTPAEREQWSCRVIAALDTALPDILPATEHAAWERCERLLPHALGVLQRLGRTAESLTCASVAYKVAQYLRERGRYGEAEPLLIRALHIRERLLGAEHPEVARILNYLAILSLQQGHYQKAETLAQRALHLWEQALSPQHPDVARCLNTLAVLSWGQGRYRKTAALCQRALQIWERALGPGHPLVATALKNLASVFTEQGRYAHAEALARRALSIEEQTLGPEHPSVAFSLSELADLYREQGSYERAEPLYQRARAIREQALGPEHPELAVTLGGLAQLRQAQGQSAQAELLAQRALSIFELALGPDHPAVAWTLRQLANLARDQGRHAEASGLYQRALSVQEQQLGQQHPEMAHTLHELALLKRQQGQLGDACSLAERALRIRSQSLGAAHPKTTATRTLCAQLVQEQAAGATSLATEQAGEAMASTSSEACQTEPVSLSLPKEAAGPSPTGDPLQAFLDACCERDPRAWCRGSDLWQAYQHWAEEHQERFPLSRRAFAAQVKAHGGWADRTSAARLWRGITLLSGHTMTQYDKT